MKSFTKFLFVLTLLLVMFTQKPFAQYIEIGNGTGYGAYPAYYGPWGNYWENCRTQQLYLASELGAPTGKKFTQLAWNFQQIPTGNNILYNVTIKIKETTATSLVSGAYADMTGATQVFYASSLVPATATGWSTFDITDYIWSGSNNIIVEVLWGDNGYYVSPYYRTYKTAGSVTRTIIGYADSETPPNYDGATTDYDNMRWYWVPLNPPGNVEGYVFNYDGLTISGATVAVQGGPSTTSDASGHYYLADVNFGSQTIVCAKAGYNPNTVTLNIPSGSTVTHDFVLTQPNMVVNPLYIEETLNPGEYFTTSMNILNNGNGPLDWAAEVVYPETAAASSGNGNVLIQSVEPNGDASIGYGEMTGDGNRDLMVCPDGSLFSVPPVGSTNAYTSTASAGYKCYQSFSGVDGSISTVNFWGVFAGYTLPAAPGNFTIEFYAAGSTPGALVYSETQSLLGQNTGQLLLGSYQIGLFTATLASSVDLAAGWVSVQWQASPVFYWNNTSAGAGFPAMQNSTQLAERLATCLSGGGAGSWLTMDYYEGTVPPFGGVANIPTHLDAAGTLPGEVYTADIVFTSNPNVSTITVPVTMIIMGNELIAPENLQVTLLDDVNGTVGLTWEWSGDAFQFFLIKRDGVIVGTTTNTNYTDLLPDYGEFCYTVQAVYDEGATSPAGPECVEWPNPVLYVNPANLEGWVWAGFTVDVYTTISNLGEGTLAYSFPEYAALDLINNPNIQHNTPGTPMDTRSMGEMDKGDASLDGAGYPIVLGAGGPDNFGYVWIDSDEDGGPTYSWIDISATGTSVSTSTLGDDGKVGPFNIGFPFEFYGEQKDQFWINSNGAVSFNSSYFTYTNTGIPTNNAAYIDFIAGFWDDMYSAYAGCAVYYQSFADYLVVQYDNTSRLGASAYTMDMEFIIYKNGKIKIQYKDITSGFTLNSATVGIQSSTPALGLQVAFNTTYVHNNLALLFSLPAHFIVDVQPAFGTIASGESQGITITYDSQDYEPGDYTEDLELNSNDPDYETFIIGNTMHVYTPAEFVGFVHDNDNGDPLPGVTVTAGGFQTTTNDDGNYSLYVDQGEYDVTFARLGYQTVTVADTFALAGVETPISIGMWDENYAPGMVHAEVMDADTWCQVTWTFPEGPYEIVMDDGEADDYFIYSSAGSMNAVKFTPTAYPATVIGGQIYVGDGNFPGPFLGTSFSVAIFDDDGPNGLPGTRLDSTGVTVNNYGWVSFDWLNATFEDGNFYLAMIQTAPAPFAAPIGVDTDNPTYFRSYSKFGDSPWVLSPLQDFMMRAWVDGPEGAVTTESAPAKVWRATPRVPANWQQYAQTQSGTLPKILPGYERTDATYKGVESMSSRNVTNYRVARYSNFDPNGSPTAGTTSELASTGNLYYNDNAWGGLPMGWYAYGVKALYTSGLYSNYTVSNIVGHLMDYQVTVNVTLSTGLEPINCEIQLKGSDWPYETYFAVTPASGTVVFDQVWRGHYDITAFKIGYDTYTIDNAFINSDKVYNIMLSEKKYPPTCLTVDPVSLEATWCEPLRTALQENFEGTQFPPAGWQVLTQGDADGWERTDDGSSSSWTIPSWDSFYAMSNDDAAGSESDGCCDYLITPGVDLRESDGYAMSFNSFYDGAFGQLAFVEYSTDGGSTWEVLYQVNPATAWADIELDLSAFSGLAGPAQVWFAFHADDAGQWASGWAIDNVLVQVPAPAANYLDFWVFLDDAFEGVTTETNWNYAPLWYGQTYTASVAARYTSGLSAKDYYTFFCEYLFPPDSLSGFAPDNAAILSWYPPLEYWPVLAGTSYPMYSKSVSEFIPGTLADGNALNRREAKDIEISNSGTRDVGEVLYQFPAPSPIGLCWGICDDGENLWVSDPNVSATAIYQVTYEGEYTGTQITVSQGQSWVGDMVSDGEFLYGCLVGGPNTIVKVDIATGETVGTITGAWTSTSQRGLGADFVNEEFYIGGWNSNQIWRTDFEGATISTFGFTGVSGLAWHPMGGPEQAGSLWVMVNASSNLVTEVDPNASWATLQSFMIPGGESYSGAGMEISLNNDYTPGALWICNQTENVIYLVDSGEPLTTGPHAGLPENLLGYNVYRDGDFVAYTPHTPEGEIEWQGYVDEGLQPGIYQYTVTAVYDLARYGFPGETGESMEEGPAEVVVDFCYALDFMETWGLGSFDDNNWVTDGGNWTINGQEGQPSPAAEFTWDPIQTNYEQNLESYPLCAVDMTEGKIWFDFDLKLDDVQPTGEEMLQAQVWNWETKEWSTVAEFSNADGSFDWTAQHVNIRSLAMGKVFKVRFHVTGVNSINILSWFVDNIHIYRACDGPSGLTVDAIANNQTGMLLNWTGPDTGQIDTWIHWDDGVNAGNSIGTGGAVEFDVAQRWEPAQLAEYEGASVTEIAFFPSEAQCTYNVRVWIGAGAANLVVDQNVPSPIIGAWNYVTLATPVPVDITQELWVGYYVNAQTGYPAGVDDGPAIDGYGNMMNFGGWQTLLEINPDLDFNWNIAAHLVTVTGVSMPLVKSVAPITSSPVTFTSNPAIVSVNQAFAPGNGSRDLTGFNIYRSVDGGDYELLDYTTETTYLDDEANPVIGGLYCYMVSAVWESETDQCESAFSNEACDIWTSIGDGNNSAAGSFNLYPNPANDHVFITTSGELKRVTVYNALGQLVVDQITTGKQYELNTASYTIGVYMVKVETEAGVTTRTLTVQR